MKKLIIAALVLSVLSIAAISTTHKWKAQKAATHFVLLDSAKIFDLAAMRAVRPTPALLAEAARIYRQGADSMSVNSDAAVDLYLRSLRTFPVPDVLESYSYVVVHGGVYDESRSERLKALADSLRGNVTWSQYLEGAKYALAQNDTNATISLLGWCMSSDTLAYRAVDKEEAFRSLENFPDYYYLMDNYLHEDAGQQSSLRTMRFSKVAGMPYRLSEEALFRKFDYIFDSARGTYNSPYTLQDDAMRDLVRGNRYGRFSRETDHGVQYTATLDLSKNFFTYIYSTQDDVNRGSRMSDELEVVEAPPAPPAKTEKLDESNATPVSEVQEPYNEPSKFYLVTLDKYGKKIAEQQIGCSCSPIHISTASIDKSGLIEVKEIEQIWKKDPLKAGYKDNEVASRKMIALKHYKVKDDGTIIAITENATAKSQ